MRQQLVSKKIVSIVLFVVIIFDLIVSYYCYLQAPIMGDLSNIILPHPACRHILEDPLGFRALMTGERYISPNRFFVHWFCYTYFNNVPFFFQNFTNPIDSIYVSCAVFKLFTQIGITSILTYWVVGKKSIFNVQFLLIFGLISSLSLASSTGYFLPMKYIAVSIVYTFAYPFSFLFVLLYMHPFVCMYRGFRKPKLQYWEHVVLFLMSFLVVFHGPINAPSAILISALILLVLWYKQLQQLKVKYSIKSFFIAIQKIRWTFLFHFIWLSLLGCYSFYIGLFNLENPGKIPTIFERYNLLFKGVVRTFFIQKTTPLPIIVLTIVFYLIINKKFKSEESKRAFDIIKYVLLFSVIYTLMLPFGGHRAYRNFIFRFDTILPITCGIFILFGIAVNILLKELKGKRAGQLQFFFVVLIVASSLMDSLSLWSIADNDCERSTLFLLSEATEEPVFIPNCSVLSWEPIPLKRAKVPSNQSKMLHRWNVLKRPIRYYHKSENKKTKK